MQTRNWQIEAFVFDFDGTLAELNIDFPLMRKSVLRIIKGFDCAVDGLQHRFVLEMIDEAKELIARRRPAGAADFLAATYELITDFEMEAARRGGLFAGTRDMLRELRKRGMKTGVISRNCLAAITAVFPDIHDYCNAVMTRESVLRVKPHPDHLNATLSSLEAAAEDAAMVGDHPMDIEVGKRAGTRTVGVLTGHSDYRRLHEAGADIILAKASDIVTLIS